jgi:hypothetical protein
MRQLRPGVHAGSGLRYSLGSHRSESAGLMRGGGAHYFLTISPTTARKTPKQGGAERLPFLLQKQAMSISNGNSRFRF